MAEDIKKLQEKLAKLEKENAKLKEGQKELSCKVSAKGGVSVYGMGRWPVTLYQGQWERIFEFVPQIKAFIAKNESKLSKKDNGAGEESED